jgi:hypothetical protein
MGSPDELSKGTLAGNIEALNDEAIFLIPNRLSAPVQPLAGCIFRR